MKAAQAAGILPRRRLFICWSGHMPELPEVEVTRRGFAHRIQGATVQGVELGKPLRWPLGCTPETLLGQMVQGVTRRGKYLLVQLSRGLILIHLGMSGSLSFAEELPVAGPHDHFTLRTDRGVLRLNDPRRFGAVVYATGMHDPVVGKLLGRLGVEPLSNEFVAAEFAQRVRLRKTGIKQILLAGDLVVGVGNIYASEALFAARIHPTAVGQTIGVRKLLGLHAAIVDVLSLAVEQGGSTLRNFSGADGQAGHFQLQAKVYGRDGAPCVVCNEPIQRMQQGQRSSFFCPKCQKV